MHSAASGPEHRRSDVGALRRREHRRCPRASNRAGVHRGAKSAERQQDADAHRSDDSRGDPRRDERETAGPLRSSPTATATAMTGPASWV